MSAPGDRRPDPERRGVSMWAIGAIPAIEPGDDLAAILIGALEDEAAEPRDHDVLVVAQKVVSKAEGRYRVLEEVVPGRAAIELAGRAAKDPRLVELMLGESAGVLAHRPGLIIAAHRLGMVMANAGIDRSNLAPGGEAERVLLLPEDPDASAAGLKRALDARFGAALGVVVADSTGRAWRNGVTGIALGVAGLPALRDLRGRRDLYGRALETTTVGFADQLAAAASLLLGEADEGTPAVVIRGLRWSEPALPASALVRPRDQDLFR